MFMGFNVFVTVFTLVRIYNTNDHNVNKLNIYNFISNDVFFFLLFDQSSIGCLTYEMQW